MVLVASAYRFAVDSEYDYIVVFKLRRLVAFYNVKNCLLGKLIVARTVFFKFFYFFFKSGRFFLVADYFDHLPSGGHAKFGKQITDKLHVAIVYAVETYRINIVNYYDAFDHPLT